MHNVREDALATKIHTFLDRKAHQYPDLHLRDNWGDHKAVVPPPSMGEIHHQRTPEMGAL